MKPAPAIMIIGARRRCGLYSPTSALAFGMIVPRPMPVSRRITRSWGTEVTRAVRIIIPAKNSVAPMSTGRRPIRSASMLKKSAPIRTPKLAAANTGPSAALGTPHSRTIDGAV